MDGARFDALTRTLTAASSRRRAIAAVLSGSLGLLGLAHPDDATAARSGKCKPKCGACEKCRRGDCDKKNGKKVCKRGKCKPKPTGTPCGTGKTCQSGTCRLSCPVPCAGGDCSSGACVCPGGTERCGDACLPLCGAMKARDPLTCGCCGTSDASCTGDGDCCAGLACTPDGPGKVCTVPISDRAVKANLASVDPVDMLARVRDLPITTWNYTSDDPTIRHIGPMAQDFAATFGVGVDDRHIHPIDGHGVALAAIQGLAAEVERLREENAALAARLAALEQVPGAG
jgi:hypothetical protein